MSVIEQWNDHRIVVSRQTVRLALRIIDPDGVAQRLSRRLQPRQYKARGPNFLWHIDGYDKLKPFEFWVHGCMRWVQSPYYVARGGFNK